LIPRVAGAFDVTLEPRMDDQNSTRGRASGRSTGGGVNAMRSDNISGRGYLELTGYDEPLWLTYPSQVRIEWDSTPLRRMSPAVLLNCSGLLVTHDVL
jgi:hypothetical protein